MFVKCYSARFGSPANVLSGCYGPRAALCSFPWQVRSGGVALVVAKEILGSFHFHCGTKSLPQTRRRVMSRAKMSSQLSCHPYNQCTSQPASTMPSSHPSSPSARGHCNCPIKTWLAKKLTVVHPIQVNVMSHPTLSSSHSSYRPKFHGTIVR